MAEVVVSSFLTIIFEKLASSALKALASYVEINSEVKKLERSLLQIRNVLIDASQKEITDQSVKRWLNDLQHLTYDIDDILDDVTTEAVHREGNLQSKTSYARKVRKFLPNPFSKHSLWTRTMKDKINAITNNLQDLIEEKDALGLIVKEESSTKYIINRVLLETSVTLEPVIVGRQAEKEALVCNLFGDEPCEYQNFSILPIVGMGGVGKTTLARLLYNDNRVSAHFELKAWVCVSNEFDSFRISEIIFHFVTGEIKICKSLNMLQEVLKDHLRGKRFLLVLDDVKCESIHAWDNLVAPFHACAPGSKIIMTTRKVKLLKMMGYSNINLLQSLSHDDALSLLAMHALGVDNFDSHLSLKSHGVNIVRNCDGLPLALKTIGRLLRAKGNEEECWKEVLYSETWRLTIEDEIVPKLRVSYHDLSSRLKQLFAYCSLFPKGYMFNKEQLVQLWLAEGFLPKSNQSESTEEHLGHRYFDELLSLSFFQHAPNNESFFVMHNLINDLATFVAGEFVLRLEKDIRRETLGKYRHVSFPREEYVSYKKFEPFETTKSLRTFLALSIGEAESWQSFYLSNKILVHLLPKLLSLRVLSLKDFKISEVPESIDTLKHLRYLDLSQTVITHLPENVCNLYHLQTLILFSCHRLAKLPDRFLKLKNMRHLDIGDTPLLQKMPSGIGELENLQTLSKIIIEGQSGFHITELKDLKNLCGKISIVGLDKVQNAVLAQRANLSQKSLSELEFVWSDLPDGSRDERLEKDVFNELKPHNRLKQLEIVSYGGLEFPNWVGNPSFLQLTHVSIRGCKRCTSLPPLGQLPSLKELFITRLNGVEGVGMELLGSSCEFTSLEILSFQHMCGLKKWSINSGVAFPCLQKLFIRDCPNLAEVSFGSLLSLNVLEIFDCSSGVLRSLVEVAPSITKLDM